MTNWDSHIEVAMAQDEQAARDREQAVDRECAGCPGDLFRDCQIWERKFYEDIGKDRIVHTVELCTDCADHWDKADHSKPVCIVCEKEDVYAGHERAVEIVAYLKPKGAKTAVLCEYCKDMWGL